jgi:GH25 family lysozyme M1 (1,4-beta-N-acetylmuramidase)
MFTPRLTKPERGNPYYNRPRAGYAIGIIPGNPLDAGCDVLANCVGYAAGRFNEIIGRGCFVYWQYAPNPDKWIATAKQYGLRTGSEPQLGAVLVWGHHVAIVEEINADGTIVTSESGYGCNNPFWLTTRNNDDGCWNGGRFGKFHGFIYQPKGVEQYMKKGIDISAYQTQVDWNKVQTDFCIIQCWGGVVLGQPDAMYESHYAGAKSRGIPVGCYLFACAKTVDEAKKEADICISLLKGKQFEYPIFYDLERADILKTGKANVSAIIRAFLSKVEKAGYWVGLYCNPDVLVHYCEADIPKRYSIWLAQYNVFAPTYPCGIWQPNTAQTAGFPEPVDQDICYIDYESQIKAKGLNGYGKQPKPPEPEKKTKYVELSLDGVTYAGTLTEK